MGILTRPEIWGLVRGLMSWYLNPLKALRIQPDFLSSQWLISLDLETFLEPALFWASSWPLSEGKALSCV